MHHFTFNLPDLGEGVVEAEILTWHVSVGDFVEEDDPLVEVMTDKATVVLPAATAGRVIQTHHKIGQIVCVGQPLVEMECDVDEPAVVASPVSSNGPVARADNSNANDARQQVGCNTPSSPHLRSDAAQIEMAVAVHNSGAANHALASPAVRREARQLGVDINAVTGTGPGGQVTQSDLHRHASQTAAPTLHDDHGAAARYDSPPPLPQQDPEEGITEIHLTGMRRRMAQRLAGSHSRIPHFSYFEEVDVTALEELRTHLNKRRNEEQTRLTYLPFIMLAVARALQQHPQLNAHYDDSREVITRFNWVHLGVATQTERGLCVPVIRHVEEMELEEAGTALRRVIQSARAGTIHRDEISGSTFTISSLGRYGGIGATPVINPPEVAILGVHRAEDRAVVRSGQITIRRMMNVSASFDHRVLDGVDAAAFIQEVRDLLQHPATIFLT